MSEERTYYVKCGDGCLFEGMTKEQIIAAIAEATGSTPTSVDDAFITKIKEQRANAELKFWVGTQAQYNEIGEGNLIANCFYIVTDDTTGNDITVAIEAVQAEFDELKAAIEELQTTQATISNRDIITIQNNTAINCTDSGNWVWVGFGPSDIKFQKSNSFAVSKGIGGNIYFDNSKEVTETIKHYVLISATANINASSTAGNRGIALQGYNPSGDDGMVNDDFRAYSADGGTLVIPPMLVELYNVTDGTIQGGLTVRIVLKAKMFTGDVLSNVAITVQDMGVIE